MRGDTLMTPDHIAVRVRRSGCGRAGIGRSSWQFIDTVATTRLRLVVHAAGWLHSRVLLGQFADVDIP